MERILESVKKLMQLPCEYDHFDLDLIIHINSALAILNQFGVGPPSGMMITGPNETWDSLIQDEHLLELAKTYVYMKVRLIFDPPTVGSVMEALKSSIAEYEWRITVAVDEVKKLHGQP